VVARKKQSVTELKALVFDFETTGLPFHPNARAALQPRAIEFAGLLVDARGEELEELTFLSNPGQLITAEITKITGLTNDDLKDQPPFEHYFPQVKALVTKADIFIAHNLPFDHGILETELRVAGLLQDWPWPRLNCCTAQLYEPLWGRRPKLIQLFESVTGDKYEQTHRAIDDVRALARIVSEEKLIDQIASTPYSYGIYFPTGFRSSAR
jgi:DNA polymerase III alpha subunit (gram-positive type)